MHGENQEYWVMQSAWIYEAPEQEELVRRGTQIMNALGKDPRLTGVGVGYSGVTDDLALLIRNGESDDKTKSEISLTGIIQAFGVMDAYMRAAPAFAQAFAATPFSDGEWEWNRSSVRLFIREEASA